VAYRAGEVEVLLTVNDSDVARADKNVKATGEKIEKRPITAKVDADTKQAVDRMKDVENEAKKVVSERALLKVDADIAAAQKQFDRTQNRLEDLRLRADAGFEVGADIRRAERQLDRVQKNLEGLTNLRAEIQVDTDADTALRVLSQVEAQKQIVSRDTAIRVNANVAAAERAVSDIRGELDYLRSLSTTVDVTADVAQAEARLAGAESALKDLQGARATMQVDVAADGAKQKLQDVADLAEESGGEGGRRGGATLVGGIVGALATIPIAGAIAGIAKTVAETVQEAFRSGLAVEANQDRLQALAGLDQASAGRLARIAGEAYASNFGESIESNMDTTRLALQFRIIDSGTSNREAQKVVEGLSGIADALEEDVRPTAEAVTTLLRTGLAKSSQQAFDILASGVTNGLNRSEDLLDTFTEYPVVLRRLGLDGEQSLGLINQGLIAGARNTDVVADALKEFQIRATDGSTASADGFKRLGLSAEEMTAKIAAGGDGARDGLQTVLDKLREIEDPVQRNAAAVELFGTKAEDLGEALFALDPRTAVEGLNGVQGAAQRMFDTLASNDQAKIDGAFRSIEVAVQGIQGTLAAGFSEPLADLAEFVSQNRGPVTQFFLDLVNGALDFGSSIVEGTAAGTEAVGQFISGPLADLAQGLGKFVGIFDVDAGKGLVEYADQMRTFDDTTKATADSIRELGNGAIEEARAKVNEFGGSAVAMGYVNDASLRLADAMSVLGTNADGSRLSLEGVDLANLSASASGATLEQQLLNATAALGSQIDAAARAGESQTDLTARYNSGRDALIGQIEQMGVGRDASAALVDQILKTPTSASTAFSSNAPEQQGAVQNLARRIETLPDGSVVIRADTSPANAAVEAMIAGLSTRRVTIAVGLGGSGGLTRASGGPIFGPGGPRDDLVPVMASNGEHMLTAEEVRRMGGHGAVYRFRQMAMNGALRLADGGAVRVPSSTWRSDPPAVSAPTSMVPPAPSVAPTAAGGQTLVQVEARFEQTDPTLQARALSREIRNVLSSS
jgi:phage-related minor tail protein